MKSRRLGLIGVLSLLAVALVAPPAVTAGGGGYAYKIIYNYCDGDQPNITIKLIKDAGYYASRFQIVAQGQHKNLGGGSWYNEGGNSVFNKTIPNSSAKFTWTKSLVWNPPDGQWHRIKLRLKAFQGNSVVAAETVYTVRC